MDMDKKVTGVVAYLGIIGWLIAYLAGDKAGAKFHLNQSLVLAIAEVALGVLRAILGLIKQIFHARFIADTRTQLLR